MPSYCLLIIVQALPSLFRIWSAGCGASLFVCRRFTRSELKEADTSKDVFAACRDCVEITLKVKLAQLSVCSRWMECLTVRTSCSEKETLQARYITCLLRRPKH